MVLSVESTSARELKMYYDRGWRDQLTPFVFHRPNGDQHKTSNVVAIENHQ
jgi:hypothetical protein